MILEAVNRMLCGVGFVGIFKSKVINDEGECNGAGVMLPEEKTVYDSIVAMWLFSSLLVRISACGNAYKVFQVSTQTWPSFLCHHKWYCSTMCSGKAQKIVTYIHSSQVGYQGENS